MLIKQILAGKTSGPITTIKPDSTVSDAANLLSSKRIGALVVSNTGADVVGILSERDIVRELGKRGVACMSDQVSDLMTAKIITTTGSETAESVLSIMTENRFRHMPVMDGSTMVGIVSIGDIVSARLSEINTEKEALQGMIMGH
ncbi:CBS domain-containing protein [Amylibacter sp. IMCC11727]|uniref:CBS domain-containing protein n=1 Tax=Amylibacter sp. IMCC11727 TaxID=3039851 RepID=UPI00244DF99A|nr:CBS domain-containing protein [Amylibacter sp. IMCC11727]WGI20422.1 CBS domain-containing protein [Amylibacter sp. IMCC11727]